MSAVMRAERSEGRQTLECPFFPLLAAYLVLLSAIELGVLGASLAALHLTRPLAAIILLAALLAAWIVQHALRTESATSPWAAMDSRWGQSVAAAFIALYVFLFAAAALVPDPSWDGNSYHLPTIQQWFQQGQVSWIEGIEASTLLFMNGYPKTGETLSLFVCALLDPTLSNTLNLVYLPLGILGIASIACALGATRGTALIAGGAFLLVPINIGQSLTTYVDSAFGSAVIAWLAVMVGLRMLDPQRWGWQALVLGCALGQVIGLKGTGLLLGAMGSSALIAVQLRQRLPSTSRRALTTWWLRVALWTLAVGGFWYVRNVVHGHSPLYPIGLTVFGVTLSPGIDAYTPAGAYAVDGFIEPWPTAAQVAFTWLQGVSRWPRSMVGFDSRLGGLGFLWPLGCLPAIVMLARRRIQATMTWKDELLGQPFWFVLAIVSVGFVLLPCPWWSRFTMWIYALGLPCLAVVAGGKLGPRGRGWITACAVIAIVEAGIVVARWQVPLLGRAMPDGLLGSWKTMRVPTHFYPKSVLRGTLIESLARGDDTIGIGPLVWQQEPIVGVVSEPVGARKVSYMPADEADTAAWYERVRPRYILMHEGAVVPSVIAALQPAQHRVRGLLVLQFW